MPQGNGFVPVIPLFESEPAGGFPQEKVKHKGFVTVSTSPLYLLSLSSLS